MTTTTLDDERESVGWVYPVGYIMRVDSAVLFSRACMHGEAITGLLNCYLMALKRSWKGMWPVG